MRPLLILVGLVGTVYAQPAPVSRRAARSAITAEMRAQGWLGRGQHVGRVGLIEDGHGQSTFVIEIKAGSKLTELNAYSVDKRTGKASLAVESVTAPALARAQALYGEDAFLMPVGISRRGKTVTFEGWNHPGAGRRYEVAIGNGARLRRISPATRMTEAPLKAPPGSDIDLNRETKRKIAEIWNSTPLR